MPVFDRYVIGKIPRRAPDLEAIQIVRGDLPDNPSVREKNLNKSKDLFKKLILQCREGFIHFVKEVALAYRKSNFYIVILCLLTLFRFSANASAAPGSLDLRAWKGKVVIFDFRASWCVRCRRSFPWLNDALTAGVRCGWRTDAGHDISMRPEYYVQDGEVPADQLIGNQQQRDLYPGLEAVIFILSYRF